MTGVSTRHAYTQPVIPAPAYKSAPFHHSTLHTLRLKTEVLVLTSHIFTAHIQSICKPHLSTFRTSWVWPFITTSLLQAIIFPHLKDCNSFLTGLPVLHTTQMIFPWFKLVHAMPLLKTFQWRPKALTQHDLTLSLLVLSSVLWFPFSAQATERVCSLTYQAGFHLRAFALASHYWKCSPYSSQNGCLAPFTQGSTESPSLATLISLSYLIFFFLSFPDVMWPFVCL